MVVTAAQLSAGCGLFRVRRLNTAQVRWGHQATRLLSGPHVGSRQAMELLGEGLARQRP
jgi:hypothetical protein